MQVDVVTLAGRVRSGETTAREVVEQTLADIASPRQQEINAFVHVDEAGALTAADEVDRARDAGADPGPLAGVPFGVKELQEVAGWPHTAASEAFADRVGDTTATLVQRLTAAGAVPVGLTASPELGRSSFCSTPLHGTTRNPWDLSRTTGGSSSGSAAAVAAGVTPFCTGSDGAGSLRIPAAFCGVVGFKSTTGVVPRGPKFTGTALNQAYGVMTTTVTDTAMIMDVVAGVDDGEFGSVPSPGDFVAGLDQLPDGLRVGFSAGLGYSPVEPVVREAARTAATGLVEALGGVEEDVDWIEFPDAGPTFRALSMLDVWAQVRELPPERLALMAPSVRQYSDHVAEATFAEYLDAQQVRQQLTRTVAEVFDRVDLLITPVNPVTAFGAEGPMPRRIDGVDVDHWGSLRLTYPFNLTGHPAISLPLAPIDGVPIGLQVVGRRFADSLVLAAARRFEISQPWQRLAP